MSAGLPAVIALIEPWRAHPLAWIHRAEARSIAEELRGSGRRVTIVPFDGIATHANGTLLLRLADPVMLRAAKVLEREGVAYCGPSADAMARCYDKWVACQMAAANGIDCPETRLAAAGDEIARPIVLKPRQGSDSIGLRILRAGAVPPSARNEHTLAQEQVFGTELTIALIMAAAARLVILPFLAVLLAVASLCVAAQGASAEGAIPSFAQLEAAGAVIGEIRINAQNIFDLDDPKESAWFYRIANQLHIRTRPSVIRRALLFRSGERVSTRVIEETERELRANDYLYDVRIRPVAYRDGIVDIEVRTRDTWTLQPGFSFSRGGGSNSSGVSLQERNLFGTGVAMGFARTSTVDRTGQAFEIAHNQVFGSRTAFSLNWADYSDGSAQSISLVRPFYALDARWTLGASAGQLDRIDSIYSNDAIVSQFRHQQKSGEFFGGWSAGLIEGWVQRYSVGLGYAEDAYANEPARIPLAQLPPDQTLAYPFIRYEVIEDRYLRVVNRDKIARPEFFAMGFSARVQLGYASTSFGSTRDLWLYSGSVSKGFEPVGGGELLTGVSFSGQYGDGGGERQFYGAKARYYRPQGQRGLFYAAAALDALRNPLPTDQLLLGGDNGLRGYPMRYQSGDQRALFTLEERVYTDWYVFQLIRVGGAVFFDVGRAWGGPYENLANPGWLRDVGFGLRLANDRSSSGNVLHLDVAFPLNADASIKEVQFLVYTTVDF